MTISPGPPGSRCTPRPTSSALGSSNLGRSPRSPSPPSPDAWSRDGQPDGPVSADVWICRPEEEVPRA